MNRATQRLDKFINKIYKPYVVKKVERLGNDIGYAILREQYIERSSYSTVLLDPCLALIGTFLQSNRPVTFDETLHL